MDNTQFVMNSFAGNDDALSLDVGNHHIQAVGCKIIISLLKPRTECRCKDNKLFNISSQKLMKTIPFLCPSSPKPLYQPIEPLSV